MAQSIVSNVAGKLGELLIKEVNFLQGVDDELRSLQSEFQWFQAFLKDADATIQGGNERAKTWVNQVRDVAYDAEDAIDTYIFKIHRHRRGSHGCFSSLMTTDACHPSRLTILHDLGIEIGKVKRRAVEISANRFKYGIDSVGATSSSGSLTSNETRLPLSWKQTPVVEEVNVIGFDEDVKTLVPLLLAEDEGTQDTQRRRPVISIVGMGGLGKTTLAKKVFSNPRIKQHFACHAWVYVSQSYRDRELVESIANQLMVVGKVRMNESTDEELKRMIYEHLKERRYLVVIDDIWTRGAWDNIEAVLPAEVLNGSKVLLTTRNREVALHADRQSPPFDLKLLGEEESWELFCKKAIPTKCSKHCPPKLETIGRQMVERCGGLPLAIVVLGGLALRKEQSEEEWRKLLKSVSWQLREGEDQISKILALSYHHLPYYMKPCFLYFAMFPEDSLINARDLMLKWIAEGFIEARGEETMEEVAEEYLEELVHRSLIQVAWRNELGGITACRIHDLLLDLAISEAKGFSRMDSGESQHRGRGQNKHYWTIEEDKTLIEALVELSTDSMWRSENGFRNGYLFQLERMIKAKIPRTTLKAMPNIESRVKLLRRQTTAIADLLGISGFVWNNENSTIECEKSSYDEYVKNHKEAAGLYGKSFPFFNELAPVFTKDRAHGNARGDLGDDATQYTHENTTFEDNTGPSQLPSDDFFAFMQEPVDPSSPMTSENNVSTTSKRRKKKVLPMTLLSR